MKLQTGDIIFYSGTGLISRAIKWFTKSNVSHVAIVLSPSMEEDENFALIAEAQWGGFVISKTYKPWVEEKCAVGRVFSTLTVAQRKQFRSEAVKLLGEKYDYGALLAIAKFILFKSEKITQDANKVICSESVELIYRKMGKELVIGLPEYVTPIDIYKSKQVKIIQDFKK